MNSRLKRLHVILKTNRLGGIIVSHQPNIAYLTEFASNDSYLLLASGKIHFITDSRYYEQVRSALKGIDIILGGRPVFKTIADLILSCKIKRIGFEARNLDFAQYRQIKKFSRPARLVPTHGLIEGLRKIKDSGELAKIKKAVNIAQEALRYVKQIIRPGLREIEIAAELERFIRYKGARTSSFEIIVASGKNSAFPHHLTSRKKLKKGEPVFVDIGGDYRGYKSDLTRVFFLGKIPSKVRKIYEIVRQAQVLAIESIRPGINICEIDRRARQYIAKYGYGGFFGHNLGHGIGLEVHEQPYISPDSGAIIKEGMVFTVEPAIYLPGKFGIRIEDDVAVTKQGCKVLSAALDK
ncbi:MAG: Xaa-Pro peptidase family protein [Candidatus Omnitrophota bacterium]